MISKKKLEMLIGLYIGAIIGAFIMKFTPPFVWLILVIVLSIFFVIDWNHLNKKNNERDTEEKD